jgi:hypothetical protein
VTAARTAVRYWTLSRSTSEDPMMKRRFADLSAPALIAWVLDSGVHQAGDIKR